MVGVHFVEYKSYRRRLASASPSMGRKRGCGVGVGGGGMQTLSVCVCGTGSQTKREENIKGDDDNQGREGGGSRAGAEVQCEALDKRTPDQISRRMDGGGQEGRREGGGGGSRWGDGR